MLIQHPNKDVIRCHNTVQFQFVCKHFSLFLLHGLVCFIAKICLHCIISVLHFPLFDFVEVPRSGVVLVDKMKVNLVLVVQEAKERESCKRSCINIIGFSHFYFMASTQGSRWHQWVVHKSKTEACISDQARWCTFSEQIRCWSLPFFMQSERNIWAT